MVFRKSMSVAEDNRRFLIHILFFAKLKHVQTVYPQVQIIIYATIYIILLLVQYDLFIIFCQNEKICMQYSPSMQTNGEEQVILSPSQWNKRMSFLQKREKE